MSSFSEHAWKIGGLGTRLVYCRCSTQRSHRQQSHSQALEVWEWDYADSESTYPLTGPYFLYSFSLNFIIPYCETNCTDLYMSFFIHPGGRRLIATVFSCSIRWKKTLQFLKIWFLCIKWDCYCYIPLLVWSVYSFQKRALAGVPWFHVASKPGEGHMPSWGEKEIREGDQQRRVWQLEQV